MERHQQIHENQCNVDTTNDSDISGFKGRLFTRDYGSEVFTDSNIL